MSQSDTSRLTERPQDAVDERVTARIGNDLLDEVDQLVEDGRFDSRSHAIRAGLRNLIAGDES